MLLPKNRERRCGFLDSKRKGFARFKQLLKKFGKRENAKKAFMTESRLIMLGA